MGSQLKSLAILIWGVVVLVYACILMHMRAYGNNMEVVYTCVISSLTILIVQVAWVYKNSHNIITPSTLFLGLYYLFQNGQLLLLALQVDFFDFYVNTLSHHTTNVAVFSSISNVIAGYTYIICNATSTSHAVKQSKIDFLNSIDVSRSAVRGFIVTSLVAIPLVLLKGRVALRGGYAAVRVYEENIPFIVNFIEYLFVPFALLSLVYTKGEKRRMIEILTIIWLLITAFCGDRTTGLSGILVVALINFKTANQHSFKIKKYITFGMVAVILMFLVRIAFVARHQGSVNDMADEMQNPIVSFLTELGFSAYPLFVVMDVAPQSEEFLYGTGYIASFVSGIFPSSLDPTGVIHNLVQYRNLPQVWIDKYFNYDFGLGFSLNAEAYANFGWFGLLPLFFVNYAVFYFLERTDHAGKHSRFALYSSCVLLFLWCTLPRRDTYYIWKALIYSIVLIRWYLLSTCRKLNTRDKEQFAYI